jgi:hypothetical protein
MFVDPLLSVGILFLVAEGVIFGLLNESHMPRVPRTVRKWLRTKNNPAIIGLLWPLGVAVGMAAYQPPVPKEFFILSYLLLSFAILWTIGAFCCSSFLSNKKSQNRKGPRYRAWQSLVPIAVLSIGTYCILLVQRIETGRELLALNGILLPADDPDPPLSCNAQDIPASALRLYAGGMMFALVEGDKLPLIRRGGAGNGNPVLLGIERESDGSVALNANIIGRDGRAIARIDKNHFEINRNRFLDSLAPPRRDKSTIVLTDEDQNDLTIKLINRNSVLFSGRMYVRGDAFVQVDENGLYLVDQGVGRVHGFCVYTFHYHDDDDVVFSIP